MSERKCKCGNPIVGIPSKKYCSPKCRIDAYHQRIKERKLSKRKKPCEVCKNSFTARSNARFCSAKCRQKFWLHFHLHSYSNETE